MLTLKLLLATLTLKLLLSTLTLKLLLATLTLKFLLATLADFTGINLLPRMCDISIYMTNT